MCECVYSDSSVTGLCECGGCVQEAAQEQYFKDQLQIENEHEKLTRAEQAAQLKVEAVQKGVDWGYTHSGCRYHLSLTASDVLLSPL